MQLKDILAKIAKGEALTDEEKTFVGSYDHQKELDTAASAARRKAEGERDRFKGDLEKLQGEFEDYKTQNDPSKRLTETEKLLKRIEKLEADKKASDERAKTLERTAKIRALAKEAGLNPAKGVDSKTLDLLVDNLMREVDIEDADAVKAAFDGFKTANAGLIDAQTVGGAGVKGKPGGDPFGGANPFAKKTFNLTRQLELKVSDPAKYAELKAAAEADGE